MASTARKCRRCQGDGPLRGCNQCKLVEYCSKECQVEDWNEGHKVLCSRVPKVVKRAEEKIENFNLSSYTTRNVGTFMVTAAEARRGQIIEEHEAQDLCYDAMEMEKGSTDKLLVVLDALKHFPLSAEAWGMLGHFYQYEVTADDAKKKKYSAAALMMYDNAIASARKLNPTWGEDRTEELSWGEMENRPYLRGLLGRAIALKNCGKRSEAISQAKKLMRLNPRDNQGIRQVLCTWFLEARDTEGCTNLLRKYEANGETSLSYADVILQYLRWKKDDAVEKDVKQALYVALKSNPFVPDLLGIHGIEKDEDDPYYSPGGLKDAQMYVIDSQKLWKKFPETIDWIRSQKFVEAKIPSEHDIVDLLKSGTKFQMTCIHSDLDGNDLKESTLGGTQKRNRCIGCGLDDFHWPRQLNRPHEPSSDILVHNNDFSEKSWRKTVYTDIKEVPYWRIFLQFYEEDEDNNDDSQEELLSTIQSQRNRSVQHETAPFECKECDSPSVQFCALDNGHSAFYCSKSCMKNFLQESEPPYFDLPTSTLTVDIKHDCSIHTINLDDAFRVAGEHMPNLNSVDIFVNQEYVIKNDYSGKDKNLLLSANCLKQFLEKTRTRLISFSFRLDDCCSQEFKRMTDRCTALLPLGSMPNLEKLVLTHVGFDDISTLTRCLSVGLRVLNLNYVKMGSELKWTNSEMDTLVAKLGQLKNLITLSLADTAITDKHLEVLLPNLQSIRCLDVSGRFGNGPIGMLGSPSDEPSLTDLGLKAIAGHCPNLQTLILSYQRKVTISGVRSLLPKCPDLVELELGEVGIAPQHIADILLGAKKLLFFLYGSIGFGGPNPQEQIAVQNAVRATKGRVVVCTVSGGRVSVRLAPIHQRTQDQSMAKVERAHEQQYEPCVCNKWDGIV